MREALAIININWKAALSYRLQLVLSFTALLVAVVPVYYVGHALEPALRDKIANEGGDTFGFLVLGIAVLPLAGVAGSLLPKSIGSGIATGTLESLLLTPLRLPSLVAGLCGYGILFALLRTCLAISIGVLFGMHVSVLRIPLAAMILCLLLLAYLPVGLLASAMVLRFRTEAELPRIASISAMFLGGVYYPTKEIPAWIQRFSDVMPMTYGLRAFRQVLLQDAPLTSVVGDVAVLAAMAVVALVIGAVAFQSALKYVRRSGTLAQY